MTKLKCLLLGVVPFFMAALIAVTPPKVQAGGVSVCAIGTSTPTTATVICADGPATFYGVEFSSNSSQVALPTYIDVFNTNVANGNVDTAKIATGTLDTNKNPTHPEKRAASAGLTVIRNNAAVPMRILYTMP